MRQPIEILKLTGQQARESGFVPGIDEIFFATARRSFPPGPERDAFREKWLGRFLDHSGDPVYVALESRGAVAGYLVGTFDNAAHSPRFADMSHFREHFAEACARFPAHLHINLAATFRGLGLGARLIERFQDDVRRAGLPGLHVTTGRGMRNVTFYARCGFREIAALEKAEGAMVFLGKSV